MSAHIRKVSGKIFGWGKCKEQYPSQRKRVIVKTGMDARKQMLGEKKGDLFAGNKETTQTVYVNGKVRMWQIVFDNLSTGERIYKVFTQKMEIGRGKCAEERPGILLLPGDRKISRQHCVIFEYGDTLCLQDLNSRNHTFLNGNIVTKAAYLRNGDVIRIGNTKLKVTYSIK